MVINDYINKLLGKKPDKSEVEKNRILEIEKNSKRLINKNTKFDVKESFKDFRTNVIFSLPNSGCRRVLITSSLVSEGKSTTCINLAITCAETGAKVVVIDCDLRRPNVGKLLRDNTEKGLSNVLVNDCKLSQALHNTNYENLDVILSGAIPPNPAELLSSDNMKALVEELSKEYDYVFLDAPPVNVVTDAVVLSAVVDGVVLVTRQFVTERRLLIEAVNKLRFVNAKIIGTVINDVVSTKTGYGKYGRYKGYGSYGGYGYYK